MEYDKLLSLVKQIDIYLLNKTYLKIFGIALLGLKRKICHVKEKDINIGGYTDGNSITIITHQNLLQLDDTTLKKHIAFLFCHEALHIINSHIARKKNRNAFIWNLACDHCVNRTLANLTNYITYHNMDDKNIIFFHDIHKTDPKISPEELYNHLSDRFTDEDIDMDLVECSSGDESSNNSNSNNTTIVKFKKLKDNVTGEEYYLPKSIENLSDDDGKLENRKSILSGIWNNELASKCKGTWPSDCVLELNNAFTVQVRWESILENGILYNVQEYSERSWAYLDELITWIDLPGESKNKEKLKILISVIDTSGSIKEDDLKRFIGLNMSVSNNFDKLIFIQHDYNIQNIKELDLNFESQTDNVFNAMKEIKGRGGTSHKDVFNYIQSIYDYNEISYVMFFTDAYSDIELIYKNYDWFHQTPTAWLMTTKYKLKLEYGDYKIIYIEDYL